MDEVTDSIHHDLRTAMRLRSIRLYRHGERVGLLSAILRRFLGLEESHVSRLRYAAELHDIGKLDLPGEILDKAGALNADQSYAIRQHPRLGYRMLCRGQESLTYLASIVALQHHEYWDGSGYPDGLRGSTISPEARIVTLCDVYDALREQRVYKPALSHDQALNLILHGDECGRVRPTMFDPVLLGLLKINSEFIRATCEEAAGDPQYQT